MPSFVDRDTVRSLQGRAQLVEVLEPESYRQLHLPGAVNIPLAELDRRARVELQPALPVVVYCNDFA